MSANRAAQRRQGPALGGRRRPSPWTIVAIVVIVLFAGGVGYGVYRAQQGEPVSVPPGASATSVPIGKADAKATIDVYLDFQCPVCKAYEEQSGKTIDELVASGAAKVVYHPVAYLDRYSSTRYSSRSSAASGCAAEAGVFPAYLTLLFANQPPEGGSGLPADQLISLGRQAGAGEGFAACVNDDRYASWTKGVTDDASRAGVDSTPTVLVNGKALDNSDEALRAAVAAAQ